MQLEKAYTGYHAVLRCDATGADFGLSISSFSYGINTTGCAVFTEPEDACSRTTVCFFLDLTLFCDAALTLKHFVIVMGYSPQTCFATSSVAHNLKNTLQLVS